MYTISETILVIRFTWTMKLKTNIVTKAVENRKNTKNKNGGIPPIGGKGSCLTKTLA